MDNDLFLQYLLEHSLEEDYVYIKEHVAELTDHAAIGVLIKDEKESETLKKWSAAVLKRTMTERARKVIHTGMEKSLLTAQRVSTCSLRLRLKVPQLLAFSMSKQAIWLI